MNNIIKLNSSKKVRILYGRYDRVKVETIGMLGYTIQVYHYLMQWVMSENPPEKMIYDKKLYFYVSKQKIADDCGLSEKMVRMALDKLAGVPPTILRPFVIKYYDRQSHKLWVCLEEIPAKWVLATIPINTSRLIWIENNLNQKYVDSCIESYNKNEGFDMPALFDTNIEKKKYSEKVEKIVCDIINNNADLFQTKIAKTKTFEKCCNAVQDIYNGQFTNPRLYDISKNINTNQFDYEGWKEKINSVKNDWEKVESLINKAIKNYRLMFVPKNMPSNKTRFPKSLDKWFYDELNCNGYPSYFVFSLRKPRPQEEQYADNNAQKIFEGLPVKIQDIGNEIINDCNITNEYTLWKNLKSMYKWCDNVFDADEKVGYWVTSPFEIITKFVDYCNLNSIVVNEHTFNVQTALSKNTPFAWFISNAINEHKLNKEILKSCA